MNWTLDQLMALDTIARTGSFAAAARELHKVPSAVSYSIASLEGGLGVTLFDRSRRRATLTPEGRRLLEHGRQVLERARDMEGAALEMAAGWEAELHVVVDGALPMRLVTSCVRRFAQPDVPTRLRLEVAYQEGVLESLNRWSADFAMVLGLDASEKAEGYDVTALGDLPFVLVAAPAHPLTDPETAAEALESATELVVRDSSSRYAKNPKRPFSGTRSVVYLSDFHAKRAALLDGVGYGWLPEHLVAADMAAGRLVLGQVDLNAWAYRPALVRPAGRAKGRGASLFLQTLQEELPLT